MRAVRVHHVGRRTDRGAAIVVRVSPSQSITPSQQCYMCNDCLHYSDGACVRAVPVHHVGRRTDRGAAVVVRVSPSQRAASVVRLSMAASINAVLRTKRLG